MRESVQMAATRVLLIDDYPDALEMLGLYLRLQGFDVTTGTDGLQAVELATSASPDVIVMDLELPGISGFEAARRIRESPATSSIPLIAATGYSHDRQLDEARRIGFDAVLVKPCEPSLLVSEIQRILGQSTP